MDKYSKIHLWIGTNKTPEEEYLQYFELDYSTEGDFDSPNYKICQFCVDIGEKWYDQDFIGIIPRSTEDIEIDNILADSSIDEDEWNRIKRICEQKGIIKANAMFWYADADLKIGNIDKTFNGLKYIGVFEGD